MTTPAGTQEAVAAAREEVSALHVDYASDWSAMAEPIACVLTAVADEVSGKIPSGPFARIGDHDIGEGVGQTLRAHRSPAVLMQNRGVFAIGKDAMAAVKAAVMCEDVVGTFHLARQPGEPVSLAQDDTDHLDDRFQNVYAQRSAPTLGGG